MARNRQPQKRPARLALEDGSVFHGHAFGAKGRTIAGEVVFNTAMCGYQESLTDPSYAGQILVETFPMIGNYGINLEDVESAKVQVAGFVVRELARRHSNYRATTDLATYLTEQGIPAIEGVDTRAITRILRSGGSMRGVISDEAALSDSALVEMARHSPRMSGQNLVPQVACSSAQKWSEDLGAWSTVPASEPARVLALDCGAKRNILRNLTQRGCVVEVTPHTITSAEILDRYRKGEFDGLFLSNGPGDPAAVAGVIKMLREVLEAQPDLPVFGICLGCQLLGLALGATTYKLKFGHRGANQPVFNSDRGRVEITSQNHGFAVDADSLEALGAIITHRNLNDDTVAGFRLEGRPVFAVQHHPEASPGPHDASYLFDEFVDAMRGVEA
jgi:carbamoyl-phosphate synthase small subunit